MRTRRPACSISGTPSLRSSDRMVRCTVATLMPSSAAVLPKCSVRAKATSISRSAKVMSCAELSSMTAQGLFDVGDEVVGVLDAQRDPGEARAHRIPPPGTPVHRAVNAAEAGGRDQQGAALDERVHTGGAVQLHRDDAAVALH